MEGEDELLVVKETDAQIDEEYRRGMMAENEDTNKYSTISNNYKVEVIPDNATQHNDLDEGITD